MGENGSPPLSRRVPGTTSMPRAQVRRSPPRLPDSVLERLKAEVQAARAKETEQQATDPRQPDEASPREGSRARRKVTALPKRPRSTPPSDEPKAAPWSDDASAAPLPVRQKIAPLPQRDTIAPQIGRPKLARLLQESDWHVVPDSEESPVADSDDWTEPIPVVSPSGSGPAPKPIRELLTDQAPPTEPERPHRQIRPSRPTKLTARQTTKRATAAHPPKSAPEVPKPAARRPPGRMARRLSKRAAPQSAAANQTTMLQALFTETTDFEELVASARADAWRPLAGIDWRSVFAAAGLAALMIVVGIILMLQLFG